jgi:hypothetical protein
LGFRLFITLFRKYKNGKLILKHLGVITPEKKHQKMSYARQAKVIIQNAVYDIQFIDRSV